jgi:histidine decarboxylase
MKRPLGVFIFCVLFSGQAQALSEQDRQRLDAFAQKALEKSRSIAGYPVNQDLSLDEFYAWYAERQLYHAALNNVGNPRTKSLYSLNTHEFENEVIDYFAKLYGFPANGYWGFVTMSGTDGNNHGMYFGRRYLLAKSPLPPIAYVSEDAHYSIKKLADVQNLELRQIKASDMGQMDMADFERQLDPTRPALVVIALGTTFKGAVDDQAAIREILARKHKGPHYIHLDAALFGGYLVYAGGEAAKLVNQDIQKFDSIAVSGHKFFGSDEPMGIFISTKEAFDNLNPFHVPYLNDAVPTITCSRSGLGPLKFWWKIKSTPMTAFQAIANEMMSNAAYLVDKLEAAGVKHWRNPNSNTVFFERPDAEIMMKYDLAPEESPTFGKLAHFVVMPHIHKALIDQFADDMKRWKAGGPPAAP